MSQMKIFEKKFFLPALILRQLRMTAAEYLPYSIATHPRLCSHKILGHPVQAGAYAGSRNAGQPGPGQSISNPGIL
jgi:hypothetical protein